MYQNIVDLPPTVPRPITENPGDSEASTSAKRKHRTFDEVTFELQSYSKKPKKCETFTSIDSPLHVCDIDIKHYVYTDLPWAVSHYLKLYLIG